MNMAVRRPRAWSALAVKRIPTNTHRRCALMLRVPFVRVFRLSQEFLLTATYGGRQAVEYLKALDEGRFEKSCKRAQLAHCPKRSNISSLEHTRTTEALPFVLLTRTFTFRRHENMRAQKSAHDARVPEAGHAAGIFVWRRADPRNGAAIDETRRNERTVDEMDGQRPLQPANGGSPAAPCHQVRGFVQAQAD